MVEAIRFVFCIVDIYKVIFVLYTKIQILQVITAE